MNINVSVIIPVFNGSNYLENCIDSILSQTYKGRIELLVINDGSEDDTLKKLYSIYGNNNKINIYDKTNGGVSSARNVGLANAKGKYICFCDIDDTWYSNKLDYQINLIGKYNIDFMGSVLYDIKKNKDSMNRIYFRNILFKNYFQPSTVIMKREVFEKIGFFNENQRYAEEGNYFMRIAFANFKCYLVNTKLTNYGFNKKGFGESGLSANLREMELGELQNLKFIYNKKYINTLTYFLLVSYSIIKYIRRVVIVKFN